MSARSWQWTATALLTAIAVAACGDTVRPRFVATLTLRPDSVFLRPGEEAVFTARARDSRTNLLPDRPPFTEWWTADSTLLTLSDTLGASISVEGRVPGTAELQAQLGLATASALVHVTPPGELAIEIVPTDPEFEVGSEVELNAILTRPNGDTISGEGYRISWRVDADGAATLSASDGTMARLLGVSRGSGTATVIVSDLRESSTFTVRAP